MFRPTPTAAAVAAALAALAGCSAPEHTSPYDPQTPAELQAKATLRGTVSLEAVGGAAPVLADVVVSVTGSGAGGATTDTDGVWTLGGVAPGTYSVRATRAGYVDGWQNGVVVTLDDGGSTVTVPPIALAAARGTVAGTVALSPGAIGGFPVGTDFSGVVVTLSGVTPTLSAVTDASGGWRIDGVPVSPDGAEYTVTARRPSYEPRETTVVAIGGATVTATALALPVDAGALSGAVLLRDAVGGGGDNATHAGTIVSLTGTAFNGTSWSASAATAADGTFTLGNLPPGSYDVVATSANRVCGAFAPATVPPGETATAATVRCLDALAPTAVSLGAPEASGGQAGFVAGTSVAVPIAIAATDATSPDSNFRGYQIVAGSAADWAAASVVAGQPGTLTFSGLAANATNTLWARAVDWIGNAGPVASVQVVSDTLAPPAPSVATPRTFVNATTTSVTLRGSEGDAGFAGYEVCSYAQAAGSDCATTAPAGCTWTPTPAALALSLSAGMRTCVFARAYDRAGNRSDAAPLGAAGVVSDLTAPTPPTLAPAYDPTLLTVRAPWVDFFVIAASRDLPAGTRDWEDVAYLEVDLGSGYEPLCPATTCRPGNVWTPCGGCCSDPRLVCDGARFVGVRARLQEGFRNAVAVRAVDLAGNVGAGVSQQVEADSTGDVLAATGAIETGPNARGRLVTYAQFNPGGGNPHGVVLDLGTDRRLDAADVRCDVSPGIASGQARGIVPASDTLVLTAEFGNGLKMFRPGADGRFCTADDPAPVVVKAAALNYYTDGVSGAGEKAAWWERKNAPGAVAILYVREPGGNRIFGDGDDATATFTYSYVTSVTMGDNAILVRESACGDSCSTYTWRVINPNASGSYASGTTTLDLPAAVTRAALSADGRRLAWIEGGALKVLEPGANGIFDAGDVPVARTPPWTVSDAMEIAVDATHVVVLANGTPSYLVHWAAGPDGAFSGSPTSDDLIERILPASGPRQDPTIAGSYLAFSKGNDVLGVDLSTLRWETAPTSGVNGSEPLLTDGRGWMFYEPPSLSSLVARSPAGAELSTALSGQVAVSGKEMLSSDYLPAIWVRQPDASGTWLSPAAPAPVKVYQSGDTVLMLAVGGGNGLVVDQTWSAAHAATAAHYRVIEPGAGKTLASLTGLTSPVDVLADGIRASWAMVGAITADQVFFPCHDWATSNVYLCVHDAGADHVFGTADDPRPAAYASAVHLKHPAGSPRAGSDVYDARALKVDGKRMIVSEFSPPAVYLFDAGPDGLFNTADDRGRQLADFAAFEGDVAVAGDWAAFLDDGPPAGRQVWLVRGLDGEPTPVTSHYSAKTGVALEPSGRAFWTDYVFVPEAIFVRAP